MRHLPWLRHPLVDPITSSLGIIRRFTHQHRKDSFKQAIYPTYKTWCTLKVSRLVEWRNTDCREEDSRSGQPTLVPHTRRWQSDIICHPSGSSTTVQWPHLVRYSWPYHGLLTRKQQSLYEKLPQAVVDQLLFFIYFAKATLQASTSIVDEQSST